MDTSVAVSASTGMQFLVLGLVFFFVVLAVVGVGLWLFIPDYRASRRLAQISAGDGGRTATNWMQDGTFRVRFVEPVARTIMPSDDWRRSHLKTRLVRAGFREPRALYVYLGGKVILGLGLPLFVAMILLASGLLAVYPVACMIALGVCGIVGFFAPNLYVAHHIEERQQSVNDSFPDALDMLVVCVEAGLSIDASIQRVGAEFKGSHPVLADEFELVGLQLRAGQPLGEALTGLADRTGVEDIRAFASILVQTQRFGTSIANSLREQANDFRQIRMQRARERAAKLPVKLIFPIVTFIFPAMFVILLGPAAIRIYSAIITSTGR